MQITASGFYLDFMKNPNLSKLELHINAIATKILHAIGSLTCKISRAKQRSEKTNCETIVAYFRFVEKNVPTKVTVADGHEQFCVIAGPT